MTGTAHRCIDEMLTAARARLDRLTPNEARASARSGGVIVDIRAERYQLTEGVIPGAVIIERNVLEWRVDPTSHSRLPIARYELPVIVVCNDGYASSFAAVTLKELGIHRATDVIGGFRAWRTAGLPTTYVRSPTTGEG